MKPGVAIPAEAELLLACARRELQASQRERAAALLAGPLDVDSLYALAERHGLRPLLFRNLCDGKVGPVPPKLETRLWQHGEQLRRRNQLMEARLLEVLAVLERADIPAGVHKGPVLARLAFGDPALREYADLDVLLPLAEVPRACELLAGLGFAAKYPMSPAVGRAMLRARRHYHLMLSRGGDGLLVELHWKTDSEFPMEDTADPAWWRSAALVDIGGTPVRCLPPEDMLLALCIHGSKHHWTSLNWLADVAELSQSCPVSAWPRLLRRAEDLRCRRKLGLALVLMGRWLGVPHPDEVERWLRGVTGIETLADEIAVGWYGEQRFPGGWERLGRDISLADTWAQRLREIGNSLFQPSLPEWSRFPLPPLLFPLYVPIRVSGLVWRRLNGKNRQS